MTARDRPPQSAWRSTDPHTRSTAYRPLGAPLSADRARSSPPPALLQLASALARHAREVAELLAALGPDHALLERFSACLRGPAPSITAAAVPQEAARTFVYTHFVVRWLEADRSGPGSIAHLPLDPTIRAMLHEFQALATDPMLQAVTGRVDALLATAREAIPPSADPVVYLFAPYEAALDRRRRTHHGVFYTPVAVVDGVVGLVDQRIRDQLHLPLGLADPTTRAAQARRTGRSIPDGPDAHAPLVCILDPAAGTGAFLLGVLRRVRHTLRQHAGSRSESEHTAHWIDFLRGGFLARLLAIEQSVASAVACHLRIGLALAQTGVPADAFGPEGPVLRLTIADALATPDAEPHARHARLDAPVTVVLGNPPYSREPAAGETAHGGGWIRDGWSGWQGGRPPLSDLIEPARKRGLGGHLKSIYNLYVYFWRWSVWRVFEQGGGPGVVGFVTGASFLRGPGFTGLRHVLGKTWSGFDVVDLGGDTRGPRPSDNPFGVSVPVCITVGWRAGPRAAAARPPGRYCLLEGSRTEKLWACAELANRPENTDWRPIRGTIDDPWVAAGTTAYARWPRLTDLFPWQHSGVQFKRTWPIGVSPGLLARRWSALLDHPDRAVAVRPTKTRPIDRSPPPIHRGEARPPPLATLGPDAPVPTCLRFGHRAFDAQWALVDARLCDRPRPVLWRIHSADQIYLCSLLTGLIGDGPAAVVSAFVPDLHHFRGSYGGKDVIALWRNAAATAPNLTTGLLNQIRARLGAAIAPTDLFHYAYAVLSQPGFVRRFSTDLQVPGPRLPLTTDPVLFRHGVRLGVQLVHRHTMGHHGPTQPPLRGGPQWIQPIPPAPAPCPETFSHDPFGQTLQVGAGVLGPVSAAVMDFSVSGYAVVGSWLAQRLRQGAGRRSSPLDRIQPDAWSPTWSGDLQELVHTIAWTLALQTHLEDWLDAVLSGPLIDRDDLPSPTTTDRKPPPT